MSPDEFVDRAVIHYITRVEEQIMSACKSGGKLLRIDDNRQLQQFRTAHTDVTGRPNYFEVANLEPN